MKKIIVWFRKDLRLHDHPALVEASKQGIIISVFIWSPEEEALAGTGEASQWWLHHSLIQLQRKFQEKGISFIIRIGTYMDEMMKLVQETNADAVFFHHRYEPWYKRCDEAILTQLIAKQVEVQLFHAQLLFNPYTIKKDNNEPYKVFTPFYKRCLQEAVPRPYTYPSAMQGTTNALPSISIEQLQLLSPIGWQKKLDAYWIPGEDAAIERWNDWLTTKAAKYQEGRDAPSLDTVTKLAPYLAWGNISVRAIWHAAHKQLIHWGQAEDTLANAPATASVHAFLRQLVWRDFSYQQLIQFPNLATEPYRKEFASFPWEQNNDDIRRWQRGMTGYPLVDAGMRELWETGWMHNRVRMVTASFLVKHLLIPWTVGLQWFQDTLVDYDIANNAAGWQWTTGSGFDAAPYFRVFNPFLQGEKFDVDGHYVRRWVPELAEMPNKYIHRPWEAPSSVRAQAGVVLGDTYPMPMVNHQEARARALAAYDQVKS